MTQLRKYYAEVRQALEGSRRFKSSVLQDLKSDVEAFLAENPGATAADVRQHFGEPAAYAKEYTAAMSGEELGQKLSKVRFQKRLWLSVAALIVMIVAAVAIQIGITNNQHVAKYYFETIYEIRTEKG